MRMKRLYKINWQGSAEVDEGTLRRWANNRGVPVEKAQAARKKLKEIEQARNKRRCPADCPCTCHEGAGDWEHPGAPCPGKEGQ